MKQRHPFRRARSCGSHGSAGWPATCVASVVPEPGLDGYAASARLVAAEVRHDADTPLAQCARHGVPAQWPITEMGTPVSALAPCTRRVHGLQMPTLGSFLIAPCSSLGAPAKSNALRSTYAQKHQLKPHGFGETQSTSTKSIFRRLKMHKSVVKEMKW